MITRKDLLPEVLEQKFASSPYAMMGEASPFVSISGGGAAAGAGAGGGAAAAAGAGGGPVDE
jgi:hypothetical protein